MRRDLETIIHKAIEHEPRSRYQSAGELADDLRRYLNDRPIRARRVSWPERAVRWSRRNPLASALAAVTVSLLAAAVIGSLAAAWVFQGLAAEALSAKNKAVGALGEARAARRRERDLRRDADTMAEDRRRRLYATEMQLAQREFEGANIARARELLASQAQRIGSIGSDSGIDSGAEDLRGFEWFHLWRRCNNERQTLRGHHAPVRAVAWSPDGKLLASASGDSIKLWDAATGVSRGNIPVSITEIWSLAFSPDRASIAAGGLAPSRDPARRPGRMVIADVAAKKARIVKDGFPFPVLAVAFAPSGAEVASGMGQYRGRGANPATRIANIAVALQSGQVVLWDASSGEQRAVLPGETGSVLSLAYSHEGDALAAGCADGAVHLWNVGDRSPRQILRDHKTFVWTVAFSPDGETLASGGGKWDGPADVKLWNARDLTLKGALRGHVAGVTSLAFSPDSQSIATASWDRTARLFDVSTGKERFILSGHENYVAAIVWSPDGERLATGSWDNTARIWYARQRLDETVFDEETLSGAYSLAFSPRSNLLAAGVRDQITVVEPESQRVVARFKGHGGDTLVAFSRDGKSLIGAGIDQSVSVWSTATWEKRHSFGPVGGKVWCIAVSPDSRVVAAGSEDGKVRLWSIADGEPIKTLEGSGGAVRSLAFSHDRQWLAGACHHKGWPGASDVKIWSVAQGSVVHTIAAGAAGAHSGNIECVAFTSDDALLATCGHDRTAKLWRTKDWDLQTEIKGHREAIYHLALSPDDRTLATASWDGDVRLWSTDNGESLATLGGNAGVVWTVAFAPDGKTLVAGSSSYDPLVARSVGQIKSWRAAPSKEVDLFAADNGLARRAMRRSVAGAQGDVTGLAYSSDARSLITADTSGRIVLHDLEGATPERILATDVGPVRMVASAAGGDRFVVLNRAGELSFWDRAIGERQPTSPTGQGRIYAAAFSGDGRRLAISGDEGRASIVDGSSGEKQLDLAGATGVLGCVAYLPRGELIAAGSWDAAATLWSGLDGKLLATMRGHAWGLSSIAISPDGQFVAGGGGYGDPTLRLWDTATGNELAALTGHSDEITSLAFANDDLLLSSSLDGTVRLWDVSDKNEIGVFAVGTIPIHSLAISPTAATFATGAGNGQVQIWDLPMVRQRVRPFPAPTELPFDEK